MKAVVISLEAPLFIKKATDSTIIQRVRKGKYLYIYDGEFGGSPSQPDYSTQQYFTEPDELVKLYETPENYDNSNRVIQYVHAEIFYKTLTKTGVTAYIQGKHIKIVYKDQRELYDNTPYPDHDATDYRLEEPLAKGYPFYETEKYRLLTTIGLAPSSPTNYVYNQPLNSEKSTRRYTGALNYIKNISLDKTGRVFFGGSLLWSAERKEFDLAKGVAEELKAVISLGPYMSYDFFRKESYYFSIYGNILISYDRTFVKVSGEKGTEERFFKGFYPSIRSGILFTYKPFFIPNLNLILGSDLQVSPNYSLTADSGVIPTNWNLSTNDKVSYPFGGFITIFAGFNIFY